MPDPTSVEQIDLTPIPGKKYVSIDREWREELDLDDIAGLGCTAIWRSPVFEKNPNSYHGYDIRRRGVRA